MVHCLSFV